MAGAMYRQTDGRDRVSWLGRQLEWAGREKGAAAGELEELNLRAGGEVGVKSKHNEIKLV